MSRSHKQMRVYWHVAWKELKARYHISIKEIAELKTELEGRKRCQKLQAENIDRVIEEAHTLQAEIASQHEYIVQLEKDTYIFRDLITDYKEEIKERQKWNGMSGDELDKLLEEMYANQLASIQDNQSLEVTVG